MNYSFKLIIFFILFFSIYLLISIFYKAHAENNVTMGSPPNVIQYDHSKGLMER
ncbi:hypothetical protein [Silvanigrella aquatica]|uniref:hypothetical protein n=1 Tax=Silvanigrella aquatica TaxID=1915309 RepID=UPI000A6E979F|nr:hypothetical protein [Silvanigrella aquatica]